MDARICLRDVWLATRNNKKNTFFLSFYSVVESHPSIQPNLFISSLSCVSEFCSTTTAALLIPLRISDAKFNRIFCHQFFYLLYFKFFIFLLKVFRGVSRGENDEAIKSCSLNESNYENMKISLPFSAWCEYLNESISRTRTQTHTHTHCFCLCRCA